jgi:hypothetical protein
VGRRTTAAASREQPVKRAVTVEARAGGGGPRPPSGMAMDRGLWGCDDAEVRWSSVAAEKGQAVWPGTRPGSRRR